MKRKLIGITGVLGAGAVMAAVAVAASSPSVTTGPAKSIGQHSATLTGTVDPNGSSTTWYFQWGLTSGYGIDGKPHSAGSGVKVVAAQESASGLQPGTAYHYRLVATNGSGTTVGADRTFSTTGHPPPGVATGSAIQLSSTGATLTGAINPAGQNTTYYFQWGTTASYGQQTAMQTLAASAVSGDVSYPLQGLLAPGTIYHFRLVASHSGSATSLGGDGTFMTYPSPRPVPSVHARTTPGRARSRPYLLTTTGSVVGPSWLPHQYACYGNVTIRFFRGTKQVAFTLAGIQPDCTFTARTVFQRIPGRKHARAAALRIVIRSIANAYMATNRAPIEHVRLG